MKSEMKRWTDEKNFFWVRTCIKPNLVLSEISEMKSEMNRSTDEENVFGSEHVSSQIWCYMKLVKRRDEEWDEQMKKIFFLVQTCIKPNLVLSEISEMKRWRVRWRDEQMKKNFFWVRTCIKPNLVLSEISEMKSEMKRWTDEENFFWVRTCMKSNLVLSEISEMKRWRVRWKDEQMRKIFFGSEHVSSQIWCYLKLVRWRDEEWDEEMKKNFLGPNMYQAKSAVKNFPFTEKVTSTQTDRQTDRQTYGHYSD